MQIAAENAGRQVKHMDRRSMRVDVKHGDRKNIVTEADVLSESIIRRHLQKFPAFGIVGEEGTEISGNAGTFFVDPLDGTIPYASGMPTYGISIGLVQDNVPTRGVLYYPEDGTMLYAERGGSVSRSMAAPTPTAAHDLVVGFDYSLGMDRELQVGTYYMPLVNGTRYVLTFACVTWAVRLLIEGKIDAYVHPGATRFDWAAAAPIIEAMGGVVRNFTNEKLDFSKKRVPAIAARNQETLEIIQNLYKLE